LTAGRPGRGGVKPAGEGGTGSPKWDTPTSRGDGDFGYLNQTPKYGVNPNYLEELTAKGVKFSPENIVATTRSQSGQIVFLETGNLKAGLQHIIEEHGSQFVQMGVSEAQIPSVVMRAVSEGKLIGYQGSGAGRPVYELDINGKPQRIAVTVGSNGFVVGANPKGSVK
jgi:filamentous hemagglutinin